LVIHDWELADIQLVVNYQQPTTDVLMLEPNMRILISGASGLLGSAIRPALASQGHSISALVRGVPQVRASSGVNEVQWDPAQPLDPQKLNPFDAVIHLAGKNVAGRWTEQFKREVHDSRVVGTQTLATAAAESFRQTGMPRTIVAASAIGYYGDRGDELLTEQSPPGSGFLADTCQEWEAATTPAANAGIRVVNLRIGVVLAKHGGALQAMLPAFRLGLGGPVGNGRQYWSWIAHDDLVNIFLLALSNDQLRGPINAVGPNPARNAEFTQTLAKVLHRPAIFPLPAFVVKTLFGEMGESLLLASARVQPTRLEAAGYSFRHTELANALRSVLG
jgi:uncharacterized protein (TIGR01777 family)